MSLALFGLLSSLNLFTGVDAKDLNGYLISPSRYYPYESQDILQKNLLYVHRSLEPTSESSQPKTQILRIFALEEKHHKPYTFNFKPDSSCEIDDNSPMLHIAVGSGKFHMFQTVYRSSLKPGALELRFAKVPFNQWAMPESLPLMTSLDVDKTDVTQIDLEQQALNPDVLAAALEKYMLMTRQPDRWLDKSNMFSEIYISGRLASKL